MYKQVTRLSTAVVLLVPVVLQLLTGHCVTAGEPIVLTASQREKCLKILREGLRSDEFWPAMHAAEALTLAGLGDEVKQVVAPKISTETDDQRRCGLAREMVRAGDRSHVTNMLNILTSANTHGHVHACESLFKVFEIGDGQALRHALAKDANVTKVLMAAGALVRGGSPTAIQRIRTELASTVADHARIAAWLLGQIGNERDLEPLRTNQRRFSDPMVVAYFDHALALRGDRAGTDATIANLKSADPAIRVYAAEFSGHAGLTQTKDTLIALLEDSILDVRIRAAQSLLVLSQPPPVSVGGNIISDPYVATDANPRYSEGSVVVLKDGSLLYATTEFFGSESDFANAKIIAKSSRDGGRSWSTARVLQENVGKNNVMSVTLRRLGAAELADSPIAFSYLVKNSMHDLKVHMRSSTDEAQTFSQPILVSNDPGYHVMNNDRVARLSSGRLLAPIASTADVGSVNHFISFCYLSDDKGLTWRRSKTTVDYPQRGALEPEIFEMQDGRAAMIIRTQLGHIAIGYSIDGGETWSNATSWNVRAPEAPSTIRRIPATGDLLLIYNDTYTPGAGHGGKRTPLTTAVSKDDGKTWQHIRNIETNAEQTYAYTSVAFNRGQVLLTYYVRDERSGKISSRFRSLPVTSLYE